MTIQNALNITETGIVAHDGLGKFTGLSITGDATFIDITNGDGVAGNPFIEPAFEFETTGKDAWNGSFLESADVIVTSDGVTITLSIEKEGGGDLTAVFSDGYYAYDTTPPDTVTLTAGSDTSPQLNYVYLLQSTKTLTVSITGWPNTEHVPVATVLCQSALSLQADGAYKVHVWIDHVVDTTDNMGHVSHLNFWMRQRSATWLSGVSQTYTITPQGGAPDNVIFNTASGIVLQLHHHIFPAFSGTPDIYVVNDPVTPYKKVNDLNVLLTDSQGNSMNNRYFSLVIWGCVSEDTGDCKLFLNLPDGSYNSLVGINQNLDQFSDYTIPAEFRGTGFLISEWKLRHQAAGGGTWTSIEETNLLGLFPAVFAGGSSGMGSIFVDNAFRIVDDIDNTREIAFQADQITGPNTRTITMADQDIDLTPGVTYEAAFVWNDITGTTASMAASNGYFSNNAVLVTLTLPVVCNIGDTFKVVTKGVGLCTIAQNAGQFIRFGNQLTTVGSGGSLAATEVGDSLTIVCYDTNEFYVTNSVGSWNVT